MVWKIHDTHSVRGELPAESTAERAVCCRQNSTTYKPRIGTQNSSPVGDVEHLFRTESTAVVKAVEHKFWQPGQIAMDRWCNPNPMGYWYWASVEGV